MSGEPLDLDALAALEQAATPGPWEEYGDHLIWPSREGPAANDPLCGAAETDADAALIAAARNALPALIDAARERDVLASRLAAAERLRMDVERVLDDALGTEEGDGTGEGLVSDVMYALAVARQQGAAAATKADA